MSYLGDYYEDVVIQEEYQVDGGAVSGVVFSYIELREIKDGGYCRSVQLFGVRIWYKVRVLKLDLEQQYQLQV